ncbi:MAG: cysteine peptidase family C39 domain-containing protein [Candidatus Azobacteroides sp.]|nr:cysteine peptidase family C39 domain-containing protein [Candidatus Azobacteroides sp.]
MKFPFFMQLDGMDCGPSCLRMIAKHYGRSFSVQQLREKSYIQRTGVNLLRLSEAAESIGFRTTCVRISIQKLKEQAKLPCIIHWNQNHFVVLYQITQKKENGFSILPTPPMVC